MPDDKQTADAIRLNVSDFHEARSERNHLAWRAAQAEERMNRAALNLKRLGATDELEMLHGKDI